jgi:hypothetical protein
MRSKAPSKVNISDLALVALHSIAFSPSVIPSPRPSDITSPALPLSSRGLRSCPVIPSPYLPVFLSPSSFLFVILSPTRQSRYGDGASAAKDLLSLV